MMRIGCCCGCFCTVAGLRRSSPPRRGLAGRRSPRGQVFRAHSDLVVLHVNVFDGRSDAVPDLPQDAFSVIEDDQPQDDHVLQQRRCAGRGRPDHRQQRQHDHAPAMVVAGGAAFAECEPSGRRTVRVIFNENVRFGLPPTVAVHAQPGAGPGGARSRFAPGGKTALHDAVVAGARSPRGRAHQKRVLVVLSDGEDNASRLSRGRHARQGARAATRIIYTVSTATAGRPAMAAIRGCCASWPTSPAASPTSRTTDARSSARSRRSPATSGAATAIGYVPTNTEPRRRLPAREGDGARPRPQEPDREGPRWLPGA